MKITNFAKANMGLITIDMRSKERLSVWTTIIFMIVSVLILLDLARLLTNYVYPIDMDVTLWRLLGFFLFDALLVTSLVLMDNRYKLGCYIFFPTVVLRLLILSPYNQLFWVNFARAIALMGVVSLALLFRNNNKKSGWRIFFPKGEDDVNSSGE